jgi:CRISPR/Cas system CSM-associated protein Csm4 (group 5 of RAMP superfamily)
LEEASQREKPDIAGFSAAPDDEETAPAPAALSAYWLLSLYTPAPDDSVDWSRGHYTVLHRGGRVDGSGELKKQVAMVEEGSVLHAASTPRGSAPDVAPEGCAHPVYRAGFAVAIPIGEAR